MPKVTQDFIDALGGRGIPPMTVVEADDGTLSLTGNLDPLAARLLLFATAQPDGSFLKRGVRYVLRWHDGVLVADRAP